MQATNKMKGQELIAEYAKGMMKAAGSIPLIKPGDTVRLKLNIYEGKGEHLAGLKKIHRIAAKGKERKDTKVERIQVFEGTVIGVQGKGLTQKVTVRKLANGVGVEKTMFTHSRRVADIEIVRRSHVRRAKLYFLRDRVGKATRLREKREALKTVAAVVNTVTATES